MPLPRIHRLSAVLANQIAAGEVIERPAAAIKELIENAIDAQATAIVVRIEEGGVALIEVEDNGQGIDCADLPKATERHATSKITSVDDLGCIATMGFRGEALASLAAVSELTIASKTAADKDGWQYCPNYPQPKRMAMANGTRVIATSLFANVPARRRFLSSTATETAHCTKVVRELALANPPIKFAFYVDGKCRFDLPVSDFKQRLIDNFPLLKDNLIAVNENGVGLSLNGFVFSPTIEGGGKKIGQYFYVNGRVVKDKLLRRALMDATREFSHHGEVGYLLFFNLPPSQVDANVHPSKLEVRFVQSSAVFGFIRGAVSKAIDTPLGVPINTAVKPLPDFQTAKSMPPLSQLSNNNPTPNYSNYSHTSSAKQGSGADWASWAAAQVGEKKQGGYGQTTAPDGATIPHQPTNQPANLAIPIPDEESAQLPMGERYLGRALGLISGAFIVAENGQGLVVVDMHAAHERVIYQQLKTTYLSGEWQMQPLLIPLSLPLSELQSATLQENQDKIKGITIKWVGDNTAEISEVCATIANRADLAVLCNDILDGIAAQGDAQQIKWLQEEYFSLVACHAAVRANDSLTLLEMDTLLRQMEKTERSGVCNHGRPCWYQITTDFLNQVFRRGQ